MATAPVVPFEFVSVADQFIERLNEPDVCHCSRSVPDGYAGRGRSATAGRGYAERVQGLLSEGP
jgi:hypothetical protein